MIDPISSANTLDLAAGPSRSARTPEDAARQFEEVLVKEFVRTMTKDVFSGSLGGDETPGWIQTQGQAQADTLADVVTQHLLDQGTLGISDLLLRQWGQTGQASEEPSSPATELPSFPLSDAPAAAPFAVRPEIRFGLPDAPDAGGLDL